MSDIQKIIKSLDEAKDILSKNDVEQIEKEVIASIRSIFSKYKSKKTSNWLEDITDIRQLLNSEMWPKAVPDMMICDKEGEKEKKERGENIINLIINDSLENKKVLDYGCGEGYSALAASKTAEFSVGYDISRNRSKLSWESIQNNLLLTKNMEKVKENGPYDIVLIYDVLDHVEESPIEILKQIKELTTNASKIYIRFHPWCSRHGGHLYQQINKAFVHLILTEEELNSLGYQLEQYVDEIYEPKETYDLWLRSADFKEEEIEIVEDTFPVEEFFSKNPTISDRLGKKNLRKTNMQISFIDYVITCQ